MAAVKRRQIADTVKNAGTNTKSAQSFFLRNGRLNGRPKVGRNSDENLSQKKAKIQTKMHAKVSQKRSAKKKKEKYAKKDEPGGKN